MEIIIITVTFERSDSAFSLYFSVAYNTCAWALLLCSFFCFCFCLYSWFSSYCRCWCWWCCCFWCLCFINGILSNAQVDCRNDIMNQMKNNNIAYLKMTREPTSTMKVHLRAISVLTEYILLLLLLSKYQAIAWICDVFHSNRWTKINIIIIFNFSE